MKWWQDEEFDEELPDDVAEACAQFYGTKRDGVGFNFAQCLASFIAHQGGGTKGTHPDNPGWELHRKGESLADRAIAALDIVKALAACDPPLETEYGYCLFCFAEVEHAPSCPYRRAVELMGEP